MCNFKILVLIVCIVTCDCRRPYAGPYSIEIKSFTKCPTTEKDAFVFGTKFEVINKTHVSYSSNFTLKYGVRDSSQMIIDLSTYQNKGWKDNFMHIELNKFCTDLVRGMPGLLESLALAAGMPFQGCPIPPGKYEVKNAIIQPRFGVNVFPYNKYKMIGKVLDHGKIIGCGVVVVDVVPDNAA